MRGHRDSLPPNVRPEPLCGLVDYLPILVARKTMSTTWNNTELAMGEERCYALRVGQGNSQVDITVKEKDIPREAGMCSKNLWS